MIESKTTLSAAAWRETINQRCSALDRRLIVREQKNIIPFEIHFPKEGLRIYKVGCVFSMVMVSKLSHAEFGPSDRQEDISVSVRYTFEKNPVLTWFNVFKPIRISRNNVHQQMSVTKHEWLIWKKLALLIHCIWSMHRSKINSTNQ